MSAGEAVQFGVLLTLFLSAAAGHIILCTFSHNWWYGSALNRHAMDVVQYFHGLVALAGPIAFWWYFGFDLTNAWVRPAQPLAILLAAYLGCCLAACFFLLPAITLWRVFRPKPAALIEERSEVVDVAVQLGATPIGQSKHAFLARLPLNEVFQIDFSERTLRVPRLPAEWDGLTILHLSDFHFCGTPDRGFYEWILDRCSAQEPDLVALTGDYVDSHQHPEWLKPVFGRLRRRIAAFAILGNHDHWYDTALIRDELSAAGIQMLSNRWLEMQVRGRPLVVIGCEYPWLRPMPDLSDCPSEPFRLGLSHTPDNIAWARRQRIDLLLAGHVHGGQVRFPVLGSVFVPSQYGRRYDCGTFWEPPTLMHVSRGLGGEHPLRFRCRPEATRLILRPGN
jgi:predicted MPP superfamily phosphohydrolase